MITWPCPSCGRVLPVPEDSAGVYCESCKRKQFFKWINGPDAWGKWKLFCAQQGRMRNPKSPLPEAKR